MAAIDYSSANQYIESPNVASLNTNGTIVHENLWTLFQKLISSGVAPNEREWRYAGAFTNALDSVKKEYGVNNSEILENLDIQRRIGFYFIMYIHH